ncbi:MAG TPA: hypothetical protein DCQ50_20025 [Chryseobacterium sp.]|nr:hypothetical protein [Chryseobacterium sp.]
MYTQSRLPLYKMVMNSDAILIAETTEFSYNNNQQNEFYIENNIKFGNTFTVLKNRYNQDFKKLKLKPIIMIFMKILTVKNASE